MPELSTLEINGVSYDLRDPTKAPAGYGYGETLKVIDNSSETDFEASLDAELATMANKQSKQIAFACMGGIKDGATFFGTLTKNVSGVAFLSGATANGSQVLKRLEGGVWIPFEWINPPMSLGVEYRTTERWQGKAVYTMLVNCKAFPASGTKHFGIYGKGITRILRAVGTGETGTFTTPYYGIDSIVMVSGTVYDGEAYVVIHTEKSDLSTDNCIAQIWYIK